MPYSSSKCVVITGCDSGFGNALAKRLCNVGVFVFAGCHTEDGIRELSAFSRKNLKTFQLDVRKMLSIEEAFKFVQNNLPEDSVLWGLVNNAGIQGVNLPVEFASKDYIDQVMQVNCYGMVEMVRAFLPLLKKSRGRIVNVVSLAALTGVPQNHPYTISSYATMGFSESLRREKRQWGISVSTVCPGDYVTPMLDKNEYSRRNQGCWLAAPASLQEEYGSDYFHKQMTKHLAGVHGSYCLSEVTDCMDHALFSSYPNSVYYPGTQHVWASFCHFLPTPIMDFLVSLYFPQKKPRSLT